MTPETIQQCQDLRTVSILDKIASWLDRREVANLRREIACLRETHRLMEPRWAYLSSRDKLCSELANKVSSQAFEIAKLRGDYDVQSKLEKRK